MLEYFNSVQLHHRLKIPNSNHYFEDPWAPENFIKIALYADFWGVLK